MSDEMKITSGRMEFSDDSGPFPTEGVIEVGPNGADVQFTVPTGAMNEFMLALVEWFIGMGGINYVEQQVISREHGAFTILVQKQGGETPAVQNVRLKRELSELTLKLNGTNPPPDCPL